MLYYLWKKKKNLDKSENFATNKTQDISSILQNIDQRYLEIKEIKNRILYYPNMGFEDKHFRFVINESFLNLLKDLEILEDHNSHQAKCRYFSLVEHIYKGDVSKDQLETILTKKAKFRDDIILYYENMIQMSVDNFQQNIYAKYKLAKYIWWDDDDDPGHRRKLKFSLLMQELKSKNYLKAFYLHYKVTLNPKYLREAKAIENHIKLPIS
ncbi:MAG: hypothetical protein ACRYGR_00255 [Janthinobacterium lividum]